MREQPQGLSARALLKRTASGPREPIEQTWNRKQHYLNTLAPKLQDKELHKKEILVSDFGNVLQLILLNKSGTRNQLNENFMQCLQIQLEVKITRSRK